MKSTKTNQNKLSKNQLAVICKLSKERISSNFAICLNIKSNNTAYISNKYLQHSIFDNIQITDNFKIDLLTLVYLGAEIKNTKNNIILSTANYTKQIANYTITLKNNLQINIYDNDATAKKYFAILKNYKKSISNLQYNIITTKKIYTCKLLDFSIYPAYAKKLQEYKLGLSYNPASKKTCVFTW